MVVAVGIDRMDGPGGETREKPDHVRMTRTREQVGGLDFGGSRCVAPLARAIATSAVDSPLLSPPIAAGFKPDARRQALFPAPIKIHLSVILVEVTVQVAPDVSHRLPLRLLPPCSLARSPHLARSLCIRCPRWPPV